jgi:hypothetical protein
MQPPLSIDEALGVAPGSIVLELPEQIETASHVDIWETLYRWLQGQLPGSELPELRQAVVVGEEAFRDLLLAEQARLKDKGLLGEELDQELNRSSAEAGPSTTIQDRPLEGRWLMVLPS